MYDLREWEERFKNHTTTLRDFGDIKVLDFVNPKDGCRPVRFLFEETRYLLHISGTLGYLTARNCDNMTLDGFTDFIGDPVYFEEKVITTSRPLYEYNRPGMLEELGKLLDDNTHLLPDLALELGCEATKRAILGQVLYEFSTEKGILPQHAEILWRLLPVEYEDIQDIGKKSTKILERL